MKVAICSTVHQHDDSRVYHRQAVTLADHFDVTIYICAPFDEKKIHPTLFIKGFPIWRKKTDRIKNYFLMIKYLFRSDADVFIFHDPELILLIPFVKIFKRKKTIYDIHENYHGLIREKKWIPAPLRNAVEFTYALVEKLVFKFTDMIWYPVKDIEDYYNRYKSLNKLMVRNVPRLSQFGENHGLNEDPKNQFVFVGTMGRDRGLNEIIEAFSLFSKHNNNYQLLLAGGFYSTAYENEIKSLISSLQMDEKIKLLGKIPYQQVPQLVGESKVGILNHLPTHNYIHSLPIKLFEYLVMGVPVIASNFQNFKDVLEVNDCGVCVDPVDTEDISRAMKDLVSDETRRKQRGVNGRHVVHNDYNWEKEETRLIQAINAL